MSAGLRRGPSGKVTGIVFDPVTKPDLFDHFEVKHRALMKTLRFDQFSLRFEFRAPRSSSS